MHPDYRGEEDGILASFADHRANTNHWMPTSLLGAI